MIQTLTWSIFSSVYIDGNWLTDTPVTMCKIISEYKEPVKIKVTEGDDDKNSLISKEESPVVHNRETFINVATELLTFKVILVF